MRRSPRESRRGGAAPLFAACLVPLLALGCTGQSSKDAGDGGSESSRVGRVPYLVVAVSEEPDQLVPAFSRSPASAAIWPWILPSLVRARTDSLGRGRFEGDLAVSWQSEDEGRALRFFLDGGRYWEDTTSVGPADVVESYRLYRDPLLAGDWPRRLEAIASVDAPADGRGSVVFRFRAPLSRDRALQLASLPLISSEQWAKTKDRKPALGEPGRLVHSAGPFRIEEWKQGDYLRLARNPFAPAGRIPRSERLMLRFVASGESRAMQLQAGIADCATDLSSTGIRLLRGESPEVGLARAGMCGVEAIVWNLDDPIWGGLTLRRTLARGLDLGRIRAAATGNDDPSFMTACGGILLDQAPDLSGRTGLEATRGRSPASSPIGGASGGPAASEGRPPKPEAGGAVSSNPAATEGAAPGPAVGGATLSGPEAIGSISSSLAGEGRGTPESLAAAVDTMRLRAGQVLGIREDSAMVQDSIDAAGMAPLSAGSGAIEGPAGEASHGGIDSIGLDSIDVRRPEPAIDLSSIAADLAAFGSPSLDLVYDSSDEQRERIAIEVALQLDRLGISCRLLPLPADECTSRLEQRRFQAALIEWDQPAIRDLGEVYGTGGVYNFSGLSNASTDSLILAARSAAADTIPDAWERVETRAAASLPCIFLGRRVRIDGQGQQLAGYQRSPLEPYGDLLTLERRTAPPVSDRRHRRR